MQINVYYSPNSAQAICFPAATSHIWNNCFFILEGPEAESNGTSAIVTKLHSPTQHQVQSSLEKSSVGQR